jgi:hypothetical protein
VFCSVADYDSCCADEKNDKLRVLIRKKVDEYLDRAEKLKAHIAKADTKQAGAVGSNGKVAASGGGKYVSLSPLSTPLVDF